MKKIYHLASCSTCQHIIKEIEAGDDFELQNIKAELMTTEQVEHIKNLSGSYESLFNRRAMKYKSLGLKEKQLSEDDYKNYILEEYTFLKRPVIIIDDTIFVGNSKKVVAAAKAYIAEN